MKNALITILILLPLSACRQPSAASKVMFVDRHPASASKNAYEGGDALLLVVEIGEGGRLTLNRIDVGTTADLNLICEKLEAIFKDRARAGIDSKSITIEMKGNITGKDLDELIERLAAVNAGPIRVVKGGF